jgi:transposase-like protein
VQVVLQFVISWLIQDAGRHFARSICMETNFASEPSCPNCRSEEVVATLTRFGVTSFFCPGCEHSWVQAAKYEPHRVTTIRDTPHRKIDLRDRNGAER